MSKLIKKKPVTPGSRFRVVNKVDVSKLKPYKPLTFGKKRISGRNCSGFISIRRRGGGHKRKYRMVDFKRTLYDIPAKVLRIEYDPNRSANIALVLYKNGIYRYIIANSSLKKGDIICSTINSTDVKFTPGNRFPLGLIPLGEMVYNIELFPMAGAKMVRSAGCFAKVLFKEDGLCGLLLPSGQVRKFNFDCMASIGQIGNSLHANRVLGKAGASRWLGKRPKVRGVAMNPVDHPHGGGEGKTSSGRHPVNRYGVPTKGYKTRRKNKRSSKYIMYSNKK